MIGCEHYNERLDGCIDPRDFLRHITFSKQLNLGSYTFIVLGRVGPTGKTWFCEQLRHRGFNAVELSPSVCSYVSYDDNYNHLIVDSEQNCVIIILNRRLIDFGI